MGIMIWWDVCGPWRRPAASPPHPMVWSPRPSPAPLQQPPPWGGQPSTTIRQNLICYTYMLASCHLRSIEQDTSMQCSLPPKICPYNLSSSHMLATIKISCAIHTCWTRTTHTSHTLSTWHLYNCNTPPIPRGGCGVSYTLHHPIYNVFLPMKYL